MQYAVFARVLPSDAASWRAVDAIAAAVKRGAKTPITRAAVLDDEAGAGGGGAGGGGGAAR